jgi:hypothetical protein
MADYGLKSLSTACGGDQDAYRPNSCVAVEPPGFLEGSGVEEDKGAEVDGAGEDSGAVVVGASEV